MKKIVSILQGYTQEAPRGFHVSSPDPQPKTPPLRLQAWRTWWVAHQEPAHPGSHLGASSPQVPSQGERPRQTDRGLRPLRCVKGGGCQAGPKTIEDRSYWDSLAPRFRSSEGHWYTPTSDSRTRPVKESHVRTMCIHFLLTMLVTRRVTENHLPNHQPGLSSKFVRMLLKPS